MAMQATDERRRGSTRAIIALAVVLLLVASAILFWSNRDRGLPRPADTAASGIQGPVHTIVLPHDQPLAPLGPNRDQFEAFCVQCHSTRLVLNQPHLPEKKWGDVVHKMVVAYGAALSPEKEKDVVAYLNSILGVKTDAEAVRVR
jgi:hypothetical protein